jgi:hypothetical protein
MKKIMESWLIRAHVVKLYIPKEQKWECMKYFSRRVKKGEWGGEWELSLTSDQIPTQFSPEPPGVRISAYSEIESETWKRGGVVLFCRFLYFFYKLSLNPLLWNYYKCKRTKLSNKKYTKFPPTPLIASMPQLGNNRNSL